MSSEKKLLTFNVHGRPEQDDESIVRLAKLIKEEKPNIIALQEANQNIETEYAEKNDLLYFQPSDDESKPKKDLYPLRLVNLLSEKGLKYYWTWLHIKCGYDIYDEGIALLSPEPMQEIYTFSVSRIDDKQNWRRRAILGAKMENELVFSVHFGRWDDDEDPFAEQMKKANTFIRSKETKCTWLLGDFNAPDDRRGESYDLISSLGWFDSYQMAKKKIGYATIGGKIDGWHDHFRPMRIDQIWCSQITMVNECRVLFKNTGISDHAALMISYERK